MATDKQISANRRNSQNSTGPRTASGKAAVRTNAVKHGMLSEEIVIRSGPAQENWEEYCDLVLSLDEYWEPEGAMEELLVERIAASLWRVRRAQRAELGTIRGAIDAEVAKVNSQRHERLQDDVDRLNGVVRDPNVDSLLSQHTGVDRAAFDEAARSGLRNSSAGLRYLEKEIEEFRQQIQDEKRTSGLDRLAHFLGTEPGGLVNHLNALLKGIDNLETDKNDVKQTLSPQDLQSIFEAIDRELEDLNRRMADEARAEAVHLDTRKAKLAVPVDDKTQLILRYETTYERQFYKAIAELQRLQSRRRGEVPTPTVNVEVSRS